MQTQPLVGLIPSLGLCRPPGRRYKDDPALFGWDLINEPRCDCFPEILPPQSEWVTLEASCNVSCADALSVRMPLLPASIQCMCQTLHASPQSRHCEL